MRHRGTQAPSGPTGANLIQLKRHDGCVTDFSGRGRKKLLLTPNTELTTDQSADTANIQLGEALSFIGVS